LIYISTSCLRYTRDLSEILFLYKKAGITNIELGSNHDYVEGIDALLNNYRECNFIIHNFFPPQKVPFILNLASGNKNIRNKSVEMCKKAIAICGRSNIPLYSFHPGFRVKDTLGLDFSVKGPLIPYEMAFKNFIKSIDEILCYAKNVKVSVALENLEHRHDAYLMTKPDEFENFLAIFPEFYVLLDLGHLKIASLKLGFGVTDFIKSVKDNVIAVHIHENNGRVDNHLRPNRSKFIYDNIKYINCPNLILESRNLDITELMKELSELEKYNY